MTTAVLSEELRGYRDGFVASKAQLSELTTGLEERQLRWAPAPAEWSIAECVDHMLIVGRLLLDRIEPTVAAQAGQGQQHRGPFRYSFLDRLFVRMLEPTALIKSRAPTIYRPAQPKDTQAALTELIQLQDQLARCAELANGLDLRGVKIASPVSSMIKVSLGMWFAALLAHQRNHIQQAQRVRQNPHFPKA